MKLTLFDVQWIYQAANYNSLFMVVDTTEVYSVMAVGHEWAYKRFDDAGLNGTAPFPLYSPLNHVYCYYGVVSDHRCFLPL